MKWSFMLKRGTQISVMFGDAYDKDTLEVFLNKAKQAYLDVTQYDIREENDRTNTQTSIG